MRRLTAAALSCGRQVIRVTLLSETVLRFTRLAIDSAATQLMLVAGLACVLRGTLSLGSLLAFGAYSDMFARGCTATQDVVSALSTMRPAWCAPAHRSPPASAHRARSGTTRLHSRIA